MSSEHLDDAARRQRGLLVLRQPCGDLRRARELGVGRQRDRHDRRVLRRGARLRELSPEKRHEVRIEAKKLRYGCEFFESVYAARWPMVETLEGAISTPKAFSMAVEDIQSVLGRLNDHAAAAAYLKTVGVGVAELDVPALLDEADVVFERWAALSPFWRTSQDRHRVAVTLVRP